MSNPYPLNTLDKSASVGTNPTLENEFEICGIADRKKPEVQIALLLMLTQGWRLHSGQRGAGQI
jgi:hypothetical protein